MGSGAFMGGLANGLSQGLQQGQMLQQQREMQDLLRKEIKLKSQLQEIELDKAMRETTARKALGMAQSGVGFGEPGGAGEQAAFGPGSAVPFEALGQMQGGQAVAQGQPMSLADMAADAQMQRLMMQAGGPYADIVQKGIESDLATRQMQGFMGGQPGMGGDYYPEVSWVNGKPGVRMRARDYETVQVQNPDGSKSMVRIPKQGGGLPASPGAAMPGPAPGPAAGPVPSLGASPAAQAPQAGGLVTELSPLDIPLGKEAGRYVNAKGQAAPATMTARQASDAGFNPMSAGQEAKAEAQAKSEAEFLATVPESIESAKDMVRQIDELYDHPQLPRTVGLMGSMPGIPGVNSDALERLKQIQGGVFLQAYQKLKGAGQITEVEGLKAEQALARLGRAQTLREMKTSLKDLRDVVSGSMRRMETKKGGAPGGGGAVNWEDLPE